MAAKIRIGINGFGRIGRLAARIVLASHDLQLVAINSLSDTPSQVYLLQHDSVYGEFTKKVSYQDDIVSIDSERIKSFQVKEPMDLPWKEIGVDIVLECTGKFRTSESSQAHLEQGARHVIISAPVKDLTPTYVVGVNHTEFNPKEDKIISNSSCSTNCVASLMKVLHRALQVERGMMTTVHAATDSQNILDNSHKKGVRLGRSTLTNLIPATTGSARDVVKLFPHLKNKLVCRAIRVPTPVVSLADLVVEVGRPTTIEEVNTLFVDASKNELLGILGAAEEELVSTDYVKSPYSATLDPFLTDVIDKTLVHVVAWYDNEWGYTNRLVELAKYIAEH